MTLILDRRTDAGTQTYLEVRRLPGTEVAVLHARVATTTLTKSEWATLARVAAAWAAEGTTIRRCEECGEPTPHEGHLCLICGLDCCEAGDSACPYCAEEARCAAEERAIDYAEDLAGEEER